MPRVTGEPEEPEEPLLQAGKKGFVYHSSGCSGAAVVNLCDAIRETAPPGMGNDYESAVLFPGEEWEM